MYIILWGTRDCPPQTGIVHAQVIVISTISFYFVEKNERQFSMLRNKSWPPFLFLFLFFFNWELLSYNVNLALVNADDLNVLYGGIRTSYVFNWYRSFQPYLWCSFSQQIPVGSYKYSNPFSHHKFLHSDRHCRPLSILWHLEKEETTSLLQTSPMQI